MGNRIGARSVCYLLAVPCVMFTCVMTVTYLRGGLSACSVLRLLVSLFYGTFIKLLMQLCKNSFYVLLKPRLIPFFCAAVWLP